MNLHQLDDPTPFEPDDSFRRGVRLKGRALRNRRRRRVGAALATPLVVGAAGLAWVESRLDEVDSIEVAMPGSDLAPGDPVDILVVGTDAGLPDHDGPPNADAIALVRFDTTAGAVRVLPLPRDLDTVTADGTHLRLTNVRAASGPDGLVAAVEQLLTVDGSAPGIDHYLELDTAALAGLVDAAGGVPIHNNSGDGLVDQSSGARLEAGCQVLDGEGFVALARSRRPTDTEGTDLSDGRGDLHRIETNAFIGAGLAEALLSAQPTPEALMAFLGPVVEGLTMDSDLTLRRLAELGWQARNHTNEPGRAPVVFLPVELVTIGDSTSALALADGWPVSLEIWRGTPGSETSSAQGVEIDPESGLPVEAEVPPESDTTAPRGSFGRVTVDPNCR